MVTASGLCTGLAWAICEYLVEVTRAPTLFATHFHELTALSTSTAPPVHGPPRGPPVGIANYHVSAHIDTKSRKLAMLYKVSTVFVNYRCLVVSISTYPDTRSHICW